MDMVNSLAVAGEKIKAAATEHSSSFFRSTAAPAVAVKGDSAVPKAAAGGSEMEEAQRAMAQLEKTISEVKRSSGLKVRKHEEDTWVIQYGVGWCVGWFVSGSGRIGNIAEL